MSDAEISLMGREAGDENYLTAGTTVRSWLLTTDHKRIALLYAAGITFFFFLGGAAATLMRANLATPHGFLSADEYNRTFTLHGVIMVWFFLVPSIPTTLGNFLLPLMIGADEVAYPRLNLFSWYLYVAGGLLTLVALLAGGVDTGWTFYTPTRRSTPTAPCCGRRLESSWWASPRSPRE